MCDRFRWSDQVNDDWRLQAMRSPLDDRPCRTLEGARNDRRIRRLEQADSGGRNEVAREGGKYTSITSLDVAKR